MALLKDLRLERARGSRQFADGVFHNPAPAPGAPPVAPGLKGNPLPVMGEFFFGGRARRPRGALPIDSPLDTWARPVSSSGLRVTWLGHSTVLLEIDGVRVLTDPVFGLRASPFSFAGPKRFHPVPVTIDQLPALDAVLLSHDHYDHLCRPTMEALAKRRVPIVTSLGVGAHLERFGVDPQVIVELDWWEEHVLPGGALSFRATPAQHFSGRTPTSRNRTLWSSWVMTSARRRLFFSGDTGLTPEFTSIGEKFGPFELVMLEIGAWNQAWGDIHLGPHHALEAFRMLGGGSLLPVHWGTFDLALHAWDEPAETLFTAAQASGGARLLVPKLGAAFEPAHVDEPLPWWRAVGGAHSHAAADDEPATPETRARLAPEGSGD
jgi:L-ascorbate metabolism protein UlaG (beta-lactamase superfamily)